MEVMYFMLRAYNLCCLHDMRDCAGDHACLAAVRAPPEHFRSGCTVADIDMLWEVPEDHTGANTTCFSERVLGLLQGRRPLAV